MESVAAHKDEVTPVESKIDDLKRKSVDAKDVADHDAKNGSDEPVIKKVRKDGKEAGDNVIDDKVHSPTSERHAEGESDEDGTEDDASQDTKGTNGTGEHVNGSNGEHVNEHHDENDESESESEKGDEAPSVEKESNGETSE
ncbi:unnamed protein product [Heterobilharzia americana]|nr:unnamed protein product [Heterobilharzia americana]CAH8656716.1 unnamed protein product [Heterobilharzia americana]